MGREAIDESLLDDLKLTTKGENLALEASRPHQSGTGQPPLDTYLHTPRRPRHQRRASSKNRDIDQDATPHEIALRRVR
jgi:hypothetical protein